MTVTPIDPAALRELRHELRTPINHIVGYTELLLEEAEDIGLGDLVPNLEQVHAAGGRSLDLINSALDQSRAEAAGIDLPALRDTLRPPLDQIIAELDTLQGGRTLGDDVVRDLQRIEAAARHLMSLVGSELVAPADPHPAPPSPASPPAADSPQPPADSRQPGGDRGAPPYSGTAPPRFGHILVVDDNESNRDMLARRLERLGYTVSRAEHGQQALDMVAAASFDLVLLDIMMPVLDGYQVLERLKADTHTRDIPVIVISALDELGSVVRCIEAGAEDYLPKPFDPVLLRARVGACLEKKQLRDQEVEYLRSVARVTDAAGAVEAGTFELDALSEVSERSDGLGQLARVFQRMAREVHAREQRLKQQVQELKIEIDQTRKAREVAEITETDYFQQLQRRAKQLRGRSRPPT